MKLLTLSCMVCMSLWSVDVVAFTEKVFNDCIFMRSLHLSHPDHPEANKVFEDCTKDLTTTQKITILEQWWDRWLIGEAEDQALEAQIESEKRLINWSGCKPLFIKDQTGSINMRVTKQIRKHICL